MKTTTTRSEMIQRLVAVQNNPIICNQDILTITGFMNDAQVAAHLARYEAMALEQLYALPHQKGR